MKRLKRFFLAAVVLPVCHSFATAIETHPSLTGIYQQCHGYLKARNIRETGRSQGHVDASFVLSNKFVGGGSVPVVKESGSMVLSSSLVKLKDWIGASTWRCWVVLFTCVLTDIAATSLMKVASDKNSWQAALQSIALFLAGVSGFGLCLKQIDVSVAYAVWAAMGTAIVSCFGILFWGEAYDVKKITCLAMIVTGVIGLNLSQE